MRASDRSLTMGPLPSSWPVNVMLCFVDPGVRVRNYSFKCKNVSIRTSLSGFSFLYRKKVNYLDVNMIIPIDNFHRSKYS